MTEPEPAPNRNGAAAAIALLAVLVSCLICLGWAWGYIDHQPLHRHIVHLDPAPSDHGWITPSQPGTQP